MTESPRVALVIPAYRAAAKVGDVVKRARAALPEADVLVVDDGSLDGTAESAKAAGARVLVHQANLGKGRALSTGLRAACEAGALLIVTVDADGQHPPEHIPALLSPLTSGSADLVVGTRQRDPALMPAHRRLTNRLSSALVSRAVGFRVPDSQCGFRAMTALVASTVRPQGRRYEFETEFLLEAAEQGFKLASVDVPTIYEGTGSHFRHGSDTLAIAGVFVRHWRAILAGPEPA